MYCVRCGKELDFTIKFCSNCGKEVIIGENEESFLVKEYSIRDRMQIIELFNNAKKKENEVQYILKNI